MDTVFVLLINIFAALATGGAVVAGQCLGRQKQEEACQATTQLFLFVGAASAVVMAGMYLCRGWIVHGIFGGAEEEVLRNCETYLLIVSASIPFLALYNAGAATFRAMGNSKISMYVSLIMNGVNIGGNAIFIYGLGWGVAGAAFPTLVSRILAGVIMTALLRNQALKLHLQMCIRDRVGADVFIGVSAPGAVTTEMVKTMNKDAVVFACANPTPEIFPDDAKAGGAKVVSTGRSDFPNQINNVLAFPGIFRGAFDVRAKEINDEMKLAASEALANLITDEELSPEYIIPKAFDKRVGPCLLYTSRCV